MPFRIEVTATVDDTRANTRLKALDPMIRDRVRALTMTDVYTVDAELAPNEVQRVAEQLINPVTQRSTILDSGSRAGMTMSRDFDWAIEIGFLPGVTDNIGSTVREMIEDLFKKKLPDQQRVYTSQVTFLVGVFSAEEVKAIANGWANPLIQRIHIKSRDEFDRDGGMGIIVPRVMLTAHPSADMVEILQASDTELQTIGKQGVAERGGSRRGPLALSLNSMKVIQSYFKKLGRNPTDVELESIAQTWSEHCKHTIFASPLDEYPQGLYKSLIQKATNEIRAKKSGGDFCVSVFTDNSGVIAFDEQWLITDKAETHNSPSALDPFGGSITGIVGVNRDTIGCGLGAKPIINSYGYCVASPDDTDPLYRDAQKQQPLLSPKTLLEGIVSGVRVGGNCSGIPTTHGFVAFDHRYKGKPLVFVRTVGLMPKASAGKPTTIKCAQPGDLIVMIGGRVGKDGIHGATFSSEALTAGSPATAVQIGDPITQKKFSDAIVKEARDLGLYHSITDNGAGGLSCSVAEMAKESNGCRVDLDKVPLKYPGLAPWEIWISESQERMTLAVAPKHWEEFEQLMRRRGVEATVIGEFTNNGRCVVEYHDNTVMDIDLQFLHYGVPIEELRCQENPAPLPEPKLPEGRNVTEILLTMLKRLNLASTAFISQQYDHEVQSGSVVKPLQGRGRVQGDASVNRPLLNSHKGIVLSHGLYPWYGDVSTYHMAAAAIDTAIRNAVSAGADPDRIALMDNFCWCSSFDPWRLKQLKDAVKACYDVAVAYQTPFISGKDSMFNDFKGFDASGKPHTLSVPPTLLISSLGIIDDVRSAITLDAKIPGDLVYVLGETHDELGGSEFYSLHDTVGKNVPLVDTKKNKRLYASLAAAMEGGLVASAQSVHRGGLATALAKTAIGGMLGMSVSLAELPGSTTTNIAALWSESQGRIVVTVDPKNKEAFEKIVSGNAFAWIGVVRDGLQFTVTGKNEGEIINTTVDELKAAYEQTFKDY